MEKELWRFNENVPFLFFQYDISKEYLYFFLYITNVNIFPSTTLSRRCLCPNARRCRPPVTRHRRLDSLLPPRGLTAFVGRRSSVTSTPAPAVKPHHLWGGREGRRRSKGEKGGGWGGKEGKRRRGKADGEEEGRKKATGKSGSKREEEEKDRQWCLVVGRRATGDERGRAGSAAMRQRWWRGRKGNDWLTKNTRLFGKNKIQKNHP